MLSTEQQDKILATVRTLADRYQLKLDAFEKELASWEDDQSLRTSMTNPEVPRNDSLQRKIDFLEKGLKELNDYLPILSEHLKNGYLEFDSTLKAVQYENGGYILFYNFIVALPHDS